jgi:hypothetical protein
MPWGSVTGVRALQRWKRTLAFIGAKVQNAFAAELAGSLSGASLTQNTKDLDGKAAAEQNSRWRQEHTDAYCLARDHRYGRRSRRWLFARSLGSDMDHAYWVWVVFNRENGIVVPEIAQMPSQDPNALAEKPYNEILPR